MSMRVVGHNYEAYPDMTTPYCLACVVAVLTIDEQGLYAVYAGISPDPSMQSQEEQAELWERVASFGSKLSFSNARRHFHGFPDNMYRA